MYKETFKILTREAFERNKNDVFTGYDSHLNNTYDENYIIYIEYEKLTQDKYLKALKNFRLVQE